MNMLPWHIAINHIYLLQLENYQLDRFWRALRSRGWRGYEARQTVTWTLKLRCITAVAAVLHLAFAVVVYVALANVLELFAARFIAAVAVYALAAWGFGAWLAMATAIMQPFDIFVKYTIVRRARRRVEQCKNLTIIGVTGSYGKTTMKEALASVLEQRYTVLKTKGNQNTPLGLSRLLLSSLTHDTEILLVEMGAYGPGDIAQLCAIAQPHVSVLTGINEAHLERMGSLEVTTQTKFEIVRHARPDAYIVLNADDERVRAAAAHHVQPTQTLQWYGAQNEQSMCRITNTAFDEASLQQSASLQCGSIELGTIRTKLLGDYAWGVISGVAVVALHLKLTAQQLQTGIAQLMPLEHRLQPIATGSNILVIDDSYNGNPAGARAAMAVLKRFENRRTLYVTPGLVEMGTAASAVHEELGRELAGCVDRVVVIQTSVSDALIRGLQQQGFDAKHIIVCETAQAAHQRVQEITKPGDVILFQNDWTDNYT